ncbi:threonylcarbamoyl-AMP synthase [Candidatus Woesearchaeota archaeon]|nr:threonylcarbamoyl-AMP synthase [Candidatus Woesearchaeota archaeon]
MLMQIITPKEFLAEKEYFLNQIEEGALFVYPTDTIYGIGCDATAETSCAEVQKLKQRSKPMSVIAPSKEWILQNCEVTGSAVKWLEKLPGPFTLILPLRNLNAVAPSCILGSSALGVRLPDHWTLKLASELKGPVVSTSANISGQRPFTSLAEIPESFKEIVDFAIDEGEKKGNPSTIIDLTKNPEEVIERK